VPEFIVPVARAVFLCRHVADAGNGNVHLGWVFDAIRPETYPHTQDVICVVVQLSDGLGDVPVSVEVTLLPETPTDELETLLRTEPVISSFPDRFAVRREILRLRECIFPEPSVYLVEVYCGDVCVGDARLRMQPLSEEPVP
jgi:hypothetical protein